MKRPILLALVAAIPIETANLFYAMPPIDVGLSDDAPWTAKLICGEWVCMHLLGLLSLRWINYWGTSVYVFVLFVGGYIETTLLVVACIFLFRWFHRLARKFFNKNRLTPPGEPIKLS